MDDKPPLLVVKFEPDSVGGTKFIVEGYHTGNKKEIIIDAIQASIVNIKINNLCRYINANNYDASENVFCVSVLFIMI